MKRDAKRSGTGGRESARTDELRRRIAAEAARLAVAGGIPDLDEARRRAARLLGGEGRELPGLDEVQAAVRDYQRLFRGADQAGALRRLREAALEAMATLAAFQPRLHGAVLDGTADAGSPVLLQVFPEAPEHLALWLEDRAIPARSVERRLRLPGGEVARMPAWTFTAGGVDFELMPLPPALLRQALPGPDPGSTLPRATATALSALLADDGTDGSDVW
jgi:hypothetical protein